MALSEGIELLIGGSFAPLRDALVGAEREVEKWADASTMANRKAAAQAVYLAEETAKRKAAVLEHETQQLEAELAERQRAAEAAAKKLADAERKSAMGVTGMVAEEVRKRAQVETKAAEDLQRRLADIQKRGADARVAVSQAEARRAATIQAQEAERAQARAASGRQALASGGAALASSAVAVGLGMTVQQATSTFAAFEGVLNQVRAVSGATEAQMAAMTAQAIDLGAKTKFSAKEAAEGLSELAKAGFTAEQSMAALPGVLSLAAAGGVSVGQAAEVAAAAIAGFGLTAQDAGRVADVLAKTANLSAVGISDLQNTFKYIAPVAASASQSMEEMASAVAIMGNAGIKGEQAGTTLRGAISRLIDPPKDAAEALARMGIHLVDVQGKMLPLSTIVGELREKTARLTEQQRNQAISSIFGQEALSGMLALLRQAPEAYAETTRAIQDSKGASEEMASVMNRGLGASLEQLEGAAESLAIVFGKQFAPAAQSAAGALASMAEWTSKLPDGVLALAAGAASAGVAVLAVGSAVAGLATAWTLAAPALAAAGTALGVGLGPVAWGVAAAIAALGLAVGGFVTVAASGVGASNDSADAMARQRSEASKLLDEYDALKAKTKLSADEQARLNSIVGKLTDLVPGSVRQFDALGRATDLSREAVERHNQALDANIAKLKEQQKQARISEQQALDALGAEIAQMREGMRAQGAMVAPGYNNDAHMASLQAALSAKVSEFNARTEALRLRQIDEGAIARTWANLGPSPLMPAYTGTERSNRALGAAYSAGGENGAAGRSGLSPQSLAALDKALTQATITGATQCYRRAEQVMKLATGKALANMPGNTSLRGTPISQLPELIRSGAIKPGTAMYWNLRPGTDPRSVNVKGNLPHWGTVRPDGTIDDNHRRRWTPDEFAQAYRGRFLDATFNPFGAGGTSDPAAAQRAKNALAEAKRKAEQERRTLEAETKRLAELAATRRSRPQRSGAREGAASERMYAQDGYLFGGTVGGTSTKVSGLLGPTKGNDLQRFGAPLAREVGKDRLAFRDVPDLRRFAGELESVEKATQEAREGLNVMLGAVAEFALSPSWEKAGEVIGRTLGNPGNVDRMRTAVEGMADAFQGSYSEALAEAGKETGGFDEMVKGLGGAFGFAAGAIDPFGLALSGLSILAPAALGAIEEAINGPKGLRLAMQGLGEDMAGIKAKADLGLLTPLQAIEAQADATRAALVKVVEELAKLGGPDADAKDRNRLAQVQGRLKAGALGVERDMLLAEENGLLSRIMRRETLTGAAKDLKAQGEAADLEARVNGPLTASPLEAIRAAQDKREAQLASDQDLLGLSDAEVADQAYQDLLATVRELDEAIDQVGRGTMDASELQAERDQVADNVKAAREWAETKRNASRTAAEATEEEKKAIEAEAKAKADFEAQLDRLTERERLMATLTGKQLEIALKQLDVDEKREGSLKRRLDGETRLAQLTSLQAQQADLQGQIRDASLQRLDAEREIAALLREQADEAERIRGESIAQRQLTEAQDKAKRLAELEQQGKDQMAGLRTRYEEAKAKEIALLTQLRGVQDNLEGMKASPGSGQSGFWANADAFQAALAAIYASAPRFHSGGIVPGPRGAEVPAVLQAGEMVWDLRRVEALAEASRSGANIVGPNTLAALLALRDQGGGGGGNTANITVNITAGMGTNPHELGRVVQQALEAQLRRAGFKN